MFDQRALDLLAQAVPYASFAPLYVNGGPGHDVRTAAAGLRSQFGEPTHRPGRPDRGNEVDTAPFRPAMHDALLANAVTGLLGGQPARTDAVVDIFGVDPTPGLAAFQGSALVAAFTAGTVLAAASRLGPEGDRRGRNVFDQIVRLSASATPAGVLLRDLLAGPDVTTKLPFGGGIDGPEIPGLPGLSADFLRTAEALRKRGCAGRAAAALGKWAGAVAGSMGRYLVDVIDALDRDDCCPGDVMTIRGHDFATSQQRAVVFTKHNGGVVVVGAGAVSSWRDVEIVLTVPAGAGRGPVGIVEFPANATPLAEAASTAIGEIGDCFGPMATARLEGTIGRMTVPPLGSPVAQADGRNLYVGGPPTIRSFLRQPTTTLFPGQQVTLSWWVEDATDIEIIARPVPGSLAHELPPIVGPLPWATGSVSISVPGTHAWEAEYVLRAFNRCTGRTTPTESTLRMAMPVRTGLALGGGGTRGDFQVGAVKYLYDVKGVRPNAIAATSVGAVNGIDLVMGDDPAMSAASRLESSWLALNTESDMWVDMPWLAAAKRNVRQLARSISHEGLLALPYTLIADGIAGGDLINTFTDLRSHGGTALFTLAPIEATMRSKFDPARAAASGIKLRCVAVSVETGQLVEIDEGGNFFDFAFPAPPAPTGVGAAPPRDAVSGAIASSTMPGIFPARRIGNHTCVDGGVRDVVPVRTAVEHMGCNVVYAIKLSAPPAPMPLDPGRTFPGVMARSVLELTYDEVGNDDTDPARYGPGVTIHNIRSTVTLHDSLVIEPGLIRIAIDYGWMRAADAVDVDPAKRATAMSLSDQITALRALNWELAHEAAGDPTPDRFRSFDSFLLQGALPATRSQIHRIPDPLAVTAVRTNCLTIRSLIAQRLSLGAPTPPTAERTRWFTQWETIGSPPLSPDPWASFASRLGTLAAVSPPTPL